MTTIATSAFQNSADLASHLIIRRLSELVLPLISDESRLHQLSSADSYILEIFDTANPPCLRQET